MMAACPTGFGSTPSRVLDDMVPIGGIIIWSGAIVDIPDRFQLCDGTNSTPDLQDRFVFGAGGAQAPDTVGGSINHLHAPGGTTEVPVASGQDTWSPIDSGATDGRPPWYALAYIQRLT